MPTQRSLSRPGQLIQKKTFVISSTGQVLVPASGKKIRIYGLKFSLSADMTSVAFDFGGVSFENYQNPKSGGLYGSNNHPDYIEGATDQALNCTINGTGNITINLDYQEL